MCFHLNNYLVKAHLNPHNISFFQRLFQSLSFSVCSNLFLSTFIFFLVESAAALVIPENFLSLLSSRMWNRCFLQFFFFFSQSFSFSSQKCSSSLRLPLALRTTCSVTAPSEGINKNQKSLKK